MEPFISFFENITETLGSKGLLALGGVIGFLIPRFRSRNPTATSVLSLIWSFRGRWWRSFRNCRLFHQEEAIYLSRRLIGEGMQSGLGRLVKVPAIAILVSPALVGNWSSAFGQVKNMLVPTFVTGGDDLRGGSDNVHIAVLLRSGEELRFENVNRSASWSNNSTHNVTVPLPSRIAFENIVGVRLETTFTGGISGDNWNLDRLVIVGRINGVERILLDQTGSPLFRFTGDQRTRVFRFTTLPPPPSPPVMTRFDPRVHGFRFANNFKNIFISELNWFTSGLCGGMVYAALDYFHAGKPVPLQDYMLAEGTTLQSYIYNRQVNSIQDNLDKWTEYSFNPFGSRNREFFAWGLQFGSGRLGELIRSCGLRPGQVTANRTSIPADRFFGGLG